MKDREEKKKEKNISELWHNFKQPNICVFGKRGQERTNIWRNNSKFNFPNDHKHTQTQELQQTPFPSAEEIQVFKWKRPTEWCQVIKNPGCPIGQTESNKRAFVHLLPQASKRGTSSRSSLILTEEFRQVRWIQHSWGKLSHCQRSLHKRLPNNNNEKSMNQRGVREREKG